jgi:uncharacterized protein YoaH (UPF0181 family)
LSARLAGAFELFLSHCESYRCVLRVRIIRAVGASGDPAIDAAAEKVRACRVSDTEVRKDL